MTYLLTAVGL